MKAKLKIKQTKNKQQPSSNNLENHSKKTLKEDNKIRERVRCKNINQAIEKLREMVPAKHKKKMTRRKHFSGKSSTK